MKTIPSSALQSSGYPLKIVEPNKKEDTTPVISFNKKNFAGVLSKKGSTITDTPEAWDESWFANYE